MADGQAAHTAPRTGSQTSSSCLWVRARAQGSPPTLLRLWLPKQTGLSQEGKPT